MPRGRRRRFFWVGLGVWLWLSLPLESLAQEKKDQEEPKPEEQKQEEQKQAGQKEEGPKAEEQKGQKEEEKEGAEEPLKDEHLLQEEPDFPKLVEEDEVGGIMDEFAFLQEEELTVETATKTAKSLFEVPASVTVITRDQIRQWGVRTLTDLLRFVPGINSALSHTGLRRIDVRGRSNEYSNGVKILVDGHSMNEPFTGSALSMLDDRPLDDVKQIEIIRGPGSALYGANAFVGIINIITRDDHAATFQGRWDSDDSYFFSGYGADTLSGIKLIGHASYLNSGGPDPVIDADRFYGTKDLRMSLAPGPGDRSYERIDLGLSASWRWLKATASYSRKRRGDFAGQLYYLTYDPRKPGDRSDIRSEHLVTELQGKVPLLGDKLQLTSRVFYDHIVLDWDLRLTPLEFQLSEDLNGDGQDEYFPDGMLQRRMLHEALLGGEVQAVFVPFEGNELVAGYVYEVHRLMRARQWANFDPEVGANLPGGYQRVRDFTEPSYDREIVAAYLEDMWSIYENFTVTAGIRLDHYRDFGNAVSPRAAAVFSPLEGLYLKGLYGRAFRAPTFDELFTRGNPDLIGNPTLEPETLDTGELVVIYRRRDLIELERNRHLMDALSLRVTGYLTGINGAIEPAPRTALTGPQRLRNIGRADFRGIELEVQLSMLRLVSVGGNLTFQAAKDDDTGKDLVGIPNWLGNVWLQLIPWEGSFIHAGLNLAGPRSRPEGDNPLGLSGARLYPDRKNPLPANLDLWLALGIMDFKLGPVLLSATVRVENLLDGSLKDPTPVLTQYGDLTIPSDLPRYGRTFLINLEVNYPLKNDQAAVKP